MPYLIPSFHRPTFLFPEKGSQAIWMASSLHAEMQCSSLPQVSGTTRAATPSAIAKDLGPHASTHKPQPVHRSSFLRVVPPDLPCIDASAELTLSWLSLL
jgi:hypothetical protein